MELNKAKQEHTSANNTINTIVKDMNSLQEKMITQSHLDQLTAKLSQELENKIAAVKE